MTVQFQLSRQVLTQCDGFEIHRLQEVGQQRPLQAEHVPTQDLVTTGHGSESLPQPNAVPRGHNVTGLHWDCAFSWMRDLGQTRRGPWTEPLPGVVFLLPRLGPEATHSFVLHIIS